MSTGNRFRIPFATLLVLTSVAFAAPVLAQATSAAPPPATTAPATTPAPGASAPGAATAPDANAPAINPETGLPDTGTGAAPAPAAPAEAAPEAPKENPYGLFHIFSSGDPVTLTVGLVLAIMSGGSWLLFITKYLSSGALLGQAKQVDRLWAAGSLEEGLSRLSSRSVFRSLAQDGQAAAEQHHQLSGQVSLSEWVGNALNRSIDNISSQLRGGNSFLATVASSAPFVGLFGTVYGILKALLAIGISGQPSIDKVAGPVGEALIMTAIGLFAAVPAVVFYNVIIGRNRQVIDSLRNFASDVQTAILGGVPTSAAEARGRRR
jgi:biopolymer transport protein ExbB